MNRVVYLDYPTTKFNRVSSDSNTYSMVVADEVMADRGWYHLKLVVRPGRVSLKRMHEKTMPLLDGHNPDKPIGVIESARVENGKMTATARFSENPEAQLVLADIKNGIRMGVSPGFNITKFSEGMHKDGRPIVTAEEWEVLEISSVAVPQNPKARMTEALQFGIQINDVEEQSMDENVTTESNRMEEILEVGKEYGDAEGALEAALAGNTKEEYMSALLNKRKVYAEPAPAPEAPKVVDTKEFSLAALIRHVANPNDLRLREAAEASLDVSSKLVPGHDLRAGMEGSGSSVAVPWTAFAQTTATAAELVQQEIGTNVGPLLEANPLLQRATVYPNLTGDFQVPVFSKGAASFSVQAEGVVPASADFTVAGPKLTPKTTIVRTQVTELALLQSDGQLERGMRDMFMREASDAISAAIINGSGTNSQVGFLHTSGISSTTLTKLASAATYGELTALIANTQAAGKIAGDTSVAGGMFITHPGTMAELQGVPRSSVGVEMALRQEGRMFTCNSYPVFPSVHMPREIKSGDNNDVVNVAFLDASELHVGFWGSVRMAVVNNNPINPQFFFYVYWDVGIAHPGSVSVANYQGGTG